MSSCSMTDVLDHLKKKPTGVLKHRNGNSAELAFGKFGIRVIPDRPVGGGFRASARVYYLHEDRVIGEFKEDWGKEILCESGSVTGEEHELVSEQFYLLQCFYQGNLNRRKDTFLENLNSGFW